MADNQHRKITGYRDLTEKEIAAVNVIKEHAAAIGALIDGLSYRGNNEQDFTVDFRWMAIAKTDLQKGFMSLVRAIARPDSF